MDSVFWNFSIMKCCPHIPQEGLAFLCWRNNVIGWQYSTASWFWSRAVIIITFGTHLTYLPPHLVMFTCRHLMFIPCVFILNRHLYKSTSKSDSTWWYKSTGLDFCFVFRFGLRNAGFPDPRSPSQVRTLLGAVVGLLLYSVEDLRLIDSWEVAKRTWFDCRIGSS